MKNYVILTFFLLISFATYNYINSPDQIETKPNTIHEIETPKETKKEHIDFYKKNIAPLLNKDPSQKELEELYSKMILLFLADIGVNLDRNKKNQLKKLNQLSKYCPKINEGPEVIINPYENKEQCPQLLKVQQNKRYIQKNLGKHISFRNTFKGKLYMFMDDDIYSNFLAGFKMFTKAKKDLPSNLLTKLPTKKVIGVFHLASPKVSSDGVSKYLSEQEVNIEITQEKDYTSFNIHGEQILLSHNLTKHHPKTHSNNSGIPGQCRGMIFKNNDVQIQLITINQKKGIFFGMLFNKKSKSLLGTFLFPYDSSKTNNIIPSTLFHNL